MSYQRVKYKLINHDTNTSIWLEHDPINSDTSDKTLKREKTFGMMTELSKSLVFVKDGADFMKQAYAFKDIEANVELQEYKYHPKTSHPYLHSTGTHDFSEYKANKTEVKVPFKSGGLNALLKSQLREKFEIERLESIKGDVIDEVEKKLVALTSRKIFLISQFNVKESNNEVKSSVESNAGGTRGETVGIPVQPFSKSHEQAQFVIPNSNGSESKGISTMMFFLDADRQRALNLNLSVSFDAFVQQHENVQWARYKICLTTYQNGSNFDLKDRIVLSDLSDNSEYPNQLFGDDYDYPLPQFTVPMSASYDGTIVLEQGESLALECFLKSDMYVDNNAGVRVYAQNIVSSLVIEEDSFFDDSQTEAVLFKDIGEKLMQIITGDKNRYYSEYFTNGDFSKLALTLGFWIRKFYYEIVIEDDIETSKYAMELSLDNFLNTSNVLCNTGYSIEIMNGVETLIHENLEYFFQDAIAIDLPNQVTDLEYKSAKEFCNSSTLFGYKKGGEYDEAMGLDEYNVRSGFTLPITRVDTTYKKESDARGDAYAQEFARRKPKENYPTTDTAYDKDLHLLDLKDGLGLALEERVWQDDFEEAPKNVYSPETATNLRLTPSQIEKRHQWFYGNCLFKQQDEKVRYANGDGNKSLITKEIGGTARGEKDNLDISALAKPKFIPLWAEFEHPVDYYVNEQLNGKTNVNGRDIPNVYFKVQFIDDKGKKQRGYLFEQKKKAADLGKFKLLMAV